MSKEKFKEINDLITKFEDFEHEEGYCQYNMGKIAKELREMKLSETWKKRFPQLDDILYYHD